MRLHALHWTTSVPLMARVTSWTVT
jgi:hypothetical protein